MNTNGSYMGYVKIPNATNQPVDGRYIRLHCDRREALNLAQILVYSSEGGPNRVKAYTTATQSSQHAHYTANHVANQRGNRWYNFSHTAGTENPSWIEVDLGSMNRIYKVVVWNRTDCCQSRILGCVLTVLNADKEAVYISNPIRTTNASYTWMPPNGEVFTDRDPVRNQKPYTPSGWKCLGGINVPVRRSPDGEIECMATNGKDCLWGDAASCQRLAASPPGGLQPLACGIRHMLHYGGTGYDHAGHWCARADGML